MVVVVRIRVGTLVGTLVGTRVVIGVVGPIQVVVVGEVGRRQVGTTLVRFDSIGPWYVSVLVLGRGVLQWG